MPDIAVLSVLLHDQLIGTLTLLPGDRTLFVFEQDYIDNTQRPTLSLSFKDRYGDLITDVRPTQTRVPPFFANLLPEGKMRGYLAEQANVNPEREFFLLWVLGRDLPGAIQIHPTDGKSYPPNAARDQPEADRQKDEEKIMRFSLAGVQLKFSAVKEATGGLTIPVDGVGGSRIIKLPSTKYNGVPENEFTMMELARRIGIDVPETELIRINDIAGLPEDVEHAGDMAFAIKRFDRGDDGERVHIEDFAQIFGVYPDKKYDKASYRNIAEVIWTEIGEDGIAEFIRRLVFNTLIGNSDMHLKNWSLIYPGKQSAMLAPAYDYVSIIPYIANERLALNFVDSKSFSSFDQDQFKRFAAKSRLPEKLVLDVARETVDRFSKVWKKVDDVHLSVEVHKAIDDHLKTIPLWKDAL
jgi:serine/threonine-protein kinase HipA